MNSDMTQQQFAECLGVSKILISKIEQREKDVSKKLLEVLASKLDIHPSLLAPFLFAGDDVKLDELKPFEKKLFLFGSKIQQDLLKGKKLKCESNNELP